MSHDSSWANDLHLDSRHSISPKCMVRVRAVYNCKTALELQGFDDLLLLLLVFPFAQALSTYMSLLQPLKLLRMHSPCQKTLCSHSDVDSPCVRTAKYDFMKYQS